MSQQPTAERNIAEYDWLIDYTSRDSKLHAPTEAISQHYDAWWDGEADNYGVDEGPAPALCGRVGEWSIPGVGSRMGVARCKRCCTRLGLPQGVGSPKNDDACREVLGMPPARTYCTKCGSAFPAGHRCGRNHPMSEGLKSGE